MHPHGLSTLPIEDSLFLNADHFGIPVKFIRCDNVLPVQDFGFNAKSSFICAEIQQESLVVLSLAADNSGSLYDEFYYKEPEFHEILVFVSLHKDVKNALTS